MSMYLGYINDATAQIERSCREIRECASKLVEAAPSASDNKPIPKLPSLSDWSVFAASQGLSITQVTGVYAWLARQLSA